jgi:hypothetical protein
MGRLHAHWEMREIFDFRKISDAYGNDNLVYTKNIKFSGPVLEGIILSRTLTRMCSNASK